MGDIYDIPLFEILIRFSKNAESWVKPKIRILGGLYSANFHGGLDRLTSKARKTNPEAWFDKWDWKKNNGAFK